MERNWLIRTSQNQILGPVAKAKVLEFLQKSALGLNDEVCSGNGYWFSLNEKDLVDKYLYGDIPQGYNPISESKSVLSRRENPDKTTSLNTAPANKTQEMKLTTQGPGVLPSGDDLEYPDLTMVSTKLSDLIGPGPTTHSIEDLKLPTSDDLEFPDVNLIATSINNNPQTPTYEGHSMDASPKPKELAKVPASSEVIIYPENDDLAYPDMEAPAAQLEDEEKKKPNKDFKNEYETDSGLSLVDNGFPEENQEKAEKISQIGPVLGMVKKNEKHKEIHSEDKKLLHERKVKASSKESGTQEVSLPTEAPARVIPEHLKKRNDNYLMYVLVILVLIILGLFFYYYRNILNKPLPV